ncbi:hypothetical protein ABZP36_025800 [Zizania latifolia]
MATVDSSRLPLAHVDSSASLLSCRQDGGDGHHGWLMVKQRRRTVASAWAATAAGGGFNAGGGVGSGRRLWHRGRGGAPGRQGRSAWGWRNSARRGVQLWMLVNAGLVASELRLVLGSVAAAMDELPRSVRIYVSSKDTMNPS